MEEENPMNYVCTQWSATTVVLDQDGKKKEKERNFSLSGNDPDHITFAIHTGAFLEGECYLTRDDLVVLSGMYLALKQIPLIQTSVEFVSKPQDTKLTLSTEKTEEEGLKTQLKIKLTTRPGENDLGNSETEIFAERTSLMFLKHIAEASRTMMQLMGRPAAGNLLKNP